LRCALCRVERELRKSHIIPEFLYKTIYDYRHRLHQLSRIPDQPNQLRQKGYYERLLCGDCEAKISKWERHASRVLQGGIELTWERYGNVLVIQGFDYPSLKLFQLSVLWRSAVAKGQFFERVRLTLAEKERLRVMLQTDNPGSTETFGCLMWGLKHDGAVVKDLIVQPTSVKVEGYKCFRFTFGGVLWLFFPSSFRGSEHIRNAFLQDYGEAVLIVKPLTQAKFIMDAGAELIEMGRLTKT